VAMPTLGMKLSQKASICARSRAGEVRERGRKTVEAQPGWQGRRASPRDWGAAAAWEQGHGSKVGKRGHRPVAGPE
jgi:hypothetical protein